MIRILHTLTLIYIVLQASGLNYGESKPQLDLVKVPEAHLRNLTGKGVHVMIMDSGFYKDHECFSGADIVAEWDFVQGTQYFKPY